MATKVASAATSLAPSGLGTLTPTHSSCHANICQVPLLCLKEKKLVENKSNMENVNVMKYASLVILTLQNAVLSLSMRYSRTRNIEMFSSSAAVLMSEIVKLTVCLGLVINESRDLWTGLKSIKKTVFEEMSDTLRVCVPSFLYIIQNNLLYVAASNLDVATYQVTYQLKLLTTALFAVIILKRTLKRWQWLALLLLAIGVALVQLSSSTSQTPEDGSKSQSKLLGFSAALGACFISGFAGIYFEKMLKGSDITVWMRNVQLSLLSLPFGALTFAFTDGSFSDIFRGFDAFVWYLVCLQAGGGLLVAIVVKYADNILKGFATSLAIVLSCLAAMFFFDFHLTLQFSAGTAFVMSSIFLYSYEPKIDVKYIEKV